MKLVFKSNKLEKECTDIKIAVKKYGFDVGRKLIDLINYLEEAENLLDVSKLPQYRLHQLKGDRKYQYSIIIFKPSKYRLILYPLDEDNNIMKSMDNENLMFIKCIVIKIMEVSEHYE